MNRRKKLILSICVILVVIIIGIIYFMNRPDIEFTNNVVKLEIHSELKPEEYIKKIRNHKIDEVIINSSKVKDELGTYQITYTVNKKQYILEVEVVDTNPPVFDIKDLDIDLGMLVKAEDMVNNIQDETSTQTYFKDEYRFDQEGEQEVIVVVEDAGGNKTEKSAIINIVKDEEKPVLTGLKDIEIMIGGKPDYLSGVSAKDNRDPDPQIEVHSDNVNITKTGTYEIKYKVIDRSGNSNTYTKNVIVKEKQETTYKKPNGNKIVYLTFDDGPSSNTKKLLDVLDRYNVKATFFVTGNGQKYNSYIKEAYDKGHTIGLHTYTHNYAKVYACTDAYFDDLNKIGQMVKEQIGFVPRYIRFPGGASNTVSKRYCKGIMSTLVSEVQKRGYQYYDWNASTGDASGNNIAVNKLVAGGTASSANNIMILAHDTEAKSTTVEAIPQIIEHYQKLGYTFKGIDDEAFTPHQRVGN